MIVLFEDQLCSHLAPITTGRLAAAVTCGSYRLLDLVTQIEESVYYLARPYLQTIQAIDYPSLKVLNRSSQPANQSPKLILNARVAPTDAARIELTQLLHSKEKDRVIRHRNSIVAIVNPSVSLEQIATQGETGFAEWINQIEAPEDPNTNLFAFENPHEVIDIHMRSLDANLNRRIATGRYRELREGVFVGQGLEIGEHVLFETKDGPIIIEDQAKIGHFSLLRGPLYIGRGCKILEHSAIKDRVSLGHTTKIGGEVEASVVEPFSNKQHHGFLGHSYLGSWINLGAGTCNSDLKNTYGTVNMEYVHGKAATGMQFLGCVMGDYSKTAINTGIFTGKVIGVCSMMYGFVTSNVPSFVNYARLFGQVAALPPEVMIATQQRMFARRNVVQRDCDVRLVHDMYRLTQHERDRTPDL